MTLARNLGAKSDVYNCLVVVVDDDVVAFVVVNVRKTTDRQQGDVDRVDQGTSAVGDKDEAHLMLTKNLVGEI